MQGRDGEVGRERGTLIGEALRFFCFFFAPCPRAAFFWQFCSCRVKYRSVKGGGDLRNSAFVLCVWLWGGVAVGNSVVQVGGGVQQDKNVVKVWLSLSSGNISALIFVRHC